MKRFLIIGFISLLSLNLQASGMSHGKHKGAKESLLPECLSSVLPSPHCGRTPTAVFDETGLLHVVFSQHGHIYYSQSDDKGKTFQTPTAINSTPELIYDDGENRPKLVLGKKGQIYVSWTHKTPGRYSGDVRFARSMDSGKTFYAPLTINSDKAIIGHRFEAMTLDKNGQIFLIWIDKRDQSNAKKKKEPFAGASLYFAVSDNQGKSFSDNQRLVKHSCECCRVAIDSDNKGDVVALWRHIYPINLRDHAIAYVKPNSSPINGLPTKASDDGWKIEGCPHHGPDLSIDKNNIAHMAWFSRGEKNKGLMYGQFNLTNNQKQLSRSIDNSPSASRPQVKVLGGVVFLMWKKFNGQSVELIMSQSNDKGMSWSPNRVIATTKHNSDHPDWLSFKNTLFASWQTQAEGLRIIKVNP